MEIFEHIVISDSDCNYAALDTQKYIDFIRKGEYFIINEYLMNSIQSIFEKKYEGSTGLITILSSFEKEITIRLNYRYRGPMMYHTVGYTMHIMHMGDEIYLIKFSSESRFQKLILVDGAYNVICMIQYIINRMENSIVPMREYVTIKIKGVFAIFKKIRVDLSNFWASCLF